MLIGVAAYRTDFAMRSFLFIPGDSPKKLDKGMGSGADALLLDLEDSISPAEQGGGARDDLGIPERGDAGQAAATHLRPHQRACHRADR